MENRPQYQPQYQPQSKTKLGVLICFIPGVFPLGWIFGLFFPKGSYERKTFYRGYLRVIYFWLALFAIGFIIGLCV